MRMAHWEACEAPSEEVRQQLVHLCEVVTCDEDDIQSTLDIYVHASGHFALSCTPIGGGWDWAVARIDRREGDRRRRDVRWRGERSGDRRDPELNWTQFIETYGNGEAS